MNSNEVKLFDEFNYIREINPEYLKAFNLFLKEVSYGTFSFIMQDHKIIGCDECIKKRYKRNDK